MQHCEYCGSELRANARFCGHCGQKISSETEVTTNSSDAPIEDRTISSPATSTSLSELQNPASENDVEEEEQTPHLALENDVEEEEQTPHLALENDVEEEQRTPHDNLGSTGSRSGDLESEPEKYVDQPIGEHSRHAQTPSGKLEALSPGDAADRQGPKSRSIPKLLLILLAGIIVAAGGAAALIGLFQGNLPGTRGAANALSSSSDSEIVNTAGPSLNASICASSSTPSTPGTSGGISLTLSTTSGCSSFNSAIATSLCLIFPYNSGASHKYIYDVSNATIESKSYHLVFGIAEYTGPVTYNDAVHVSVGIGEGSTGRNFSWLYRSGNVTINSDEQSGTMDVILASQSSGNTIHVVGGWTCGRLIKNS